MSRELRLYLLTANKPTVTGRIYPMDVLEHAIKDFNNVTAPCLCDNNANFTPATTLADVTHEVKSLELDGDELFCNIKILDTPKGSMLQKMWSVLGEERFSITPSGVGTLKNRKIVKDGFVFTGVAIRPLGA